MSPVRGESAAAPEAIREPTALWGEALSLQRRLGLRRVASETNGGGVMSQENEAVVRRMVDEVWNGGRVEAIEELVSPEYVRHDPALPQVAHGPSGLADNVRLYRDAFPDLNLEIEELVSTDGTVTMRWRAAGTHRGELMGVQPTGRRSAVTGIGVPAPP